MNLHIQWQSDGQTEGMLLTKAGKWK